MVSHRTFLLTAVAVVVATVPLNAATNAPGEMSLPGRDIAETVWFQGYLADQATGEPTDGDHAVSVAIYDAEVDGGLIWGPETHDPVSVAAGWFIIEMGSVTSLPVLDTPPYYIELVVDGEPFAPRMKLASVPFALRADAAETTDDGDWVVEGGKVYPATAETLVVGDTRAMATVHVVRPSGGPLAFFGTPDNEGVASLHVAAGTDSSSSMVIAMVGPESPMSVGGIPMAGKGVMFTNPGGEGLVLGSESGPIDILVGAMEPDRAEHALRVTGDGRVGIGTGEPDTTLHVSGGFQADAIRMPTGASDGYVLTSNAVGQASWQEVAAGADSNWVVDGGRIYPATAETLGIGTTHPFAPLHVQHDADAPLAFFATTNTTGAGSIHVAAGSDSNDLLSLIKVGPECPHSVAGIPGASKGVLMTGTGAEGLIIGSESGPIDFVVGTISPERGDHALRIDENGHVGIGTDTPDTTLHVQGAVKTHAFIMENGATDGYVLTSDAGGNASWQASGGTDADWVVSGQNIYTGLTGNVGIGTTTPAAPLHIVGEGPYMSLYQSEGDSSTSTMLVQAGSDIYDLLALQKFGPSTPGQFVPGVSAAGLGAMTTGTTSSGLLLGSQGAAGIHFVTANDEKMRIAADGKVGIGTASPDTTLHVSGGVKMDAFQMAPGGTLGFVLTSDGDGRGRWERQHLIATHMETATDTIGVNYTLYDDCELEFDPPGPGYAVVTSTVTVLVEHTQGTEDRFIIGHTTNPSLILQGDGLEWTVTSDVASAPYIEYTYTLTTIHPIEGTGPESVYLVGRMSSGASPGDLFWLAKMQGIFYPDSGATKAARELELFTREAERKSARLRR
jgi:hypothetical protein